MDEFTAAFGNNLRTLRTGQKLSQEELAHRAGLHVTYLSGIERGQRNPALKNLRRIAAALGLHTKDLFNFKDSTIPSDREK